MLALALALLPSARADCAGGGLQVWPPIGAELAAGAELVIEADGTHQDRVRALRDGGAVLVSGDRAIPLRVVAALTGSFSRTQIVVRPAEPPSAGLRWTLVLGGEPVEVFHDEKRQPASWMATAVPASGPPVWTASPSVLGGEREAFGCGDGVEVVVQTAVRGATWVEASVWPTAGGARATLRVPIEDGRIRLGHGMCAGAFELVQGHGYLAELTAIDAAGRRAPAGGEPLRLTAP